MTVPASTTPEPAAPPRRRRPGAQATARLAAVAAVAVLAAGCSVRTVELQNRQPAIEYARQTQPAGSLYSGWRVYQQRCAQCHGATATGGDGAPDLTLRVRDLGPQRFVDLVLRRYDWESAAAPPGTPRETLVDEIVARERGALTMPAWQGEPVVTAHIADLYAYLSARAAGTLGPGRPAP